ncbi:MAG: hypothetical protein JNL97_12035 [Verrucomicrobiales bacterium]|nr:hypothetical protein [Verrucomicrobiales bacterium]
MPPTSPSTPPRYPPRAGKLWVGRRAKVAVRAERTRDALVGVVRWFLVAAVPGLPLGVRGHRKLALAIFAAWGLGLAGFLALQAAGFRGKTILGLPMFGVVQFDAVYLVFGLAAGTHILSVNEHLRPILQEHLRDFEPRRRLMVTIGCSLIVAAFVYWTIYAPLLGD